ncbi:MerR family transcriptional regulator [Actinoplanes sp. SE50]|uniref:helix-turn-helix domain-containing protein n=1 Tax=unclassified Actinoplanes TaxID=2626549 RepID=UPI00023EBFE1|nr:MULTISPECIES: helix-turn-helix domain-containing protein [unclassified Actinoplanes]AEV88118.1 putative heavy metal-dependent transcriptional regulator [Actinoplanes sp. SE50/110]ATO86523.1 MerR family transcriptional regulator [Actinoplanes sp. SE50]SLM03940.1 MerR family transcriptional regulator [Actinoplanes sp. SE50/110]
MPSRISDDADLPAYTMGRAAELIGVTQAFLRSLDGTGLIEPERSAGGHRRYSRHQLALAGRVRILLDEGLPLTAAVRIVTLEDRLDAAHQRIRDLGGTLTAGEDASIPMQTRGAGPSRADEGGAGAGEMRARQDV